MRSRPTPVSDGQLFDLLHRSFGIGDYDEADPVPWYKVRGVEIAKLRSMRTRRRITFEEFALMADYARRRNLRVRKPWDLLEHLPAAKRERAATKRPPAELAIEAAVAYERTHHPGSEWIERLLLAAGPGRAWALEAWQQARDLPPSQE